jgi:UDP-N-acetylglucosamine--N-acetylmuramyl-(pentapeptide) pyrophosphoryl-undecaprenol N-acetylglucosamine transferase
VTALGVAAVLVPFPQAADDHQTMNAKDLVDQGAALMLPQAGLTPERAAELIAAQLRDQPGLAALRERARAAGRLEAATVVAEAARRGFRAEEQP